MTIVNTQDNPVVPIVGTKDADAVLIESEQVTNNLVHYQIEKISGANIYNIDSAMSGKSGGNLVSVNRRILKIVLESRTRYRVRTKSQFGSYSAWVNFTTRDKRYQSPDAITSLTDDTDSTAQNKGNRRIRVTNNGKASVNIHTSLGTNKRGASVTNDDTIYNDGQLQEVGNGVSTPVYIHTRLTGTDKGATVINVPKNKIARIRYTNRGATVNTIG